MYTNAKRILDPFQDSDTSHTSKGIMFRRNPREKALPWAVMVHTHKRERRPEAWGWVGGSQNGLETPKETLLREVEGEAGIVATPDAFPEDWVRPFETKKSHRSEEKQKFHCQHWYFGFLTDNMQNVPITETDEVIERGFFLLNEIPLPDYSLKNTVPSLISHIKALELVLLHIEHKVENADLWLEVVQERFGHYLR